LIIGFSILLALGLIPAILNFSLNQTLFKTSFYAGVMKRTNFYDQVPTLIVDSVMATGSTSMQGSLLSGMDQTQFIWLMKSILPPGWIESQTNAAMESVLDFLNFKTETLTLAIDLQPIKDYLVGVEGKQSIKTLLANLPDCNDDQLTQIMIAMQSGRGGFALCHPPSSDLFNMDTMLDPVINSFASSLPSMIAIYTDNQHGLLQKIINSPFFLIYKNIRQYLPLFQWICIVLALIIILLSHRSIHWMFTSLGIPLLFGSVVLTVPGVWLFITGGQGLSGVTTGTSFSSLQGFDGLLSGVVQEGLRTAGQGLLVWCVGTLALGLVFISIRLVTRE